MSGFVDTTLIDCNRQDSAEYYQDSAISDSQSNPALFTCSQGAGVKVNAGDKISLHSAFISEVGAGADTIEFTGKDIDFKEGLIYTKKVESEPDSTLSTGYKIVNYNSDLTETIIKDNNATMIISFYKTLNGENHCLLPRRYICNTDYQRFIWYDKRESNGFIGNNQDPICTLKSYDHGWINTSNGNIINPATPYQSKNRGVGINGNRYSILTRKGNTYYGDYNALVNNYNRDPAMAEYMLHQEPINLEVEVGHDSPSNIATQITRQLTTSTEEENQVVNVLTTGHTDVADTRDYHVSTRYKSPTCKTFYTGNTRNMSEKAWEDFELGDTDGTNAFLDTDAKKKNMVDYMSAYTHIGIERFEIWYWGRIWSSLPYELGTTPSGWTLNEPLLYADRGDKKPIKTTLLWDKVNLEYLNAYMKAQSHYPDNWDWKNYLAIDTNADKAFMESLTINNSRYVHWGGSPSTTNYGAGVTTGDKLGCDFMKKTDYSDYNNIVRKKLQSYMLWLDYQPENTDKYIEELDSDQYCYGIAQRYKHSDGLYYVAFNYKALGELPKYIWETGLYQDEGGIGSGLQYDILIDHQIGHDWHFSAGGNQAIALTSGYVNYDKDGNNSAVSPVDLTKNTNINTNKFIPDMRLALATDVPVIWPNISGADMVDQVYLGANEPLFNFDTANSRFYFSQLHYPEYSGNTEQSGKSNNENPSYDNKVYKLNKRMNEFNWSPDMMPYYQERSWNDESQGGAEHGTDVTRLFGHPRIIPNAIIDSHSGICIEDMGFSQSKKAWNKSMWKTLGFTYEQFYHWDDVGWSQHQGNRQYRFNDQNKASNRSNAPTTNALINVGGTTSWTSNQYNAPIMTPMLPVPVNFEGGESINYYPAISETQISSRISAQLLPMKMKTPYFCIRSNILDQSSYMSKGNPLPVINIVNKINGDGDFYFQEQSNVEFTATRDYTLTEIRTSIHDPDQTLSRVDDNSAVIYKIQRINNANMNVLQDIMGNNKKK